ncbi:SlyX family protein [Pseudohaliea sp.]|uniref:SlyX family protein n=1 Tax=Pseudohaliea sp. TaxID=2740289 RepID=UPI0032EB47BA
MAETPGADNRNAEESLQAALEALQTELAFQGDALHALDRAYAEQQQALLELKKQVSLLAARVRALDERVPAGDGEEPPPPHY